MNRLRVKSVATRILDTSFKTVVGVAMTEAEWLAAPEYRVTRRLREVQRVTMAETEWQTTSEAPRQLLKIQDYASIRQMRLIAAALTKSLQLQPDHDDAKPCDDLLEAVADRPRPWEEIEPELHSRPGNWRFAHLLPTADVISVAKTLRRLVALSMPEDHWPRVVDLIHEVVGNPFRPIVFEPEWRNSTVVTLAEGIYNDRAFDRLPILADALQDAGCECADILDHCHSVGRHFRGCWVVDRILGKS